MKSWQLQQAKAHLSQVVQEVIAGGPQEISLRGKPVVIVISKLEYERLVKPKVSLVKFLQDSPLKGLSMPLKRDPSPTRDVDL